MSGITTPQPIQRPRAQQNTVYLISSGDLRETANRQCWSEQEKMFQSLETVLCDLGRVPVRPLPFKEAAGHGFIASQREGMDVFESIDPTAPLIVAEAVWQYSNHVLSGLLSHEGPILTVANWSGTWPGLVGMLNLNGSLTKAGKPYSTLWSEDFADPAFINKLSGWLDRGKVRHPAPHVKALKKIKTPATLQKLGEALAEKLRVDKAIMGIFDEGCMGMYNAIIPDELLHPVGVYKERLSQSALYFETMQVSDREAKAVRKWLVDRGLKFDMGRNPEKKLTTDQVMTQCKMYVAAVRIADDFGCDLIGIQYQQGLKDLLPASDLVEGMLNNTDRPPVTSRDGSRILFEGEALVHFNEVDECAGLDGLMTNRVHKALGQPVENTLHDIRWGDWDASGTVDDYVWVFLISGAAPPAHFIDGWKGACSERQHPMYFQLGGGTLKGISKPGEIVWSRIFVQGGRLKMDLGRAEVVKLPEEETERRWNLTTSQWPIMHAVLYGVTRDQMMGRHKANHIQVAYADGSVAADRALLAKAAMAQAMGMDVSICGSKKNGKDWDAV